MKNKPIYYENGGIKFTIYIQNNRYYLDFYKTDGTRIRKSTKKIATKENLRYIKMQLIPDILILMGEEPTTNSEKKEYTVEEWALIHFDSLESRICEHCAFYRCVYAPVCDLGITSGKLFGNDIVAPDFGCNKWKEKEI